MAEAPKKLTIFDLQAKVDRGEKVFQVTAVDFPTAQLVDRAGIDCILIGDSLGMTALGYAEHGAGHDGRDDPSRQGDFARRQAGHRGRRSPARRLSRERRRTRSTAPCAWSRRAAPTW